MTDVSLAAWSQGISIFAVVISSSEWHCGFAVSLRGSIFAFSWVRGILFTSAVLLAVAAALLLLVCGFALFVRLRPLVGSFADG